MFIRNITIQVEYSSFYCSYGFIPLCFLFSSWCVELDQFFFVDEAGVSLDHVCHWEYELVIVHYKFVSYCPLTWEHIIPTSVSGNNIN